MIRIKGEEFSQVEQALKNRNQGDSAKEEAIVREILDNVQTRGDAALFDYTHQFDGFAVTAETLEVQPEETEKAMAAIPAELLATVQKSCRQIESYHALQKTDGFIKREPGIMLRQRVLPLDRVGVYVPGGKAAYPSSVLMNIIPAKVAGVQEICMATPANAQGEIAPLTLAAAKLAGADRIFKMGGAQAVAAFAFGTESVPRVDKITGPGNIFVALAKKMVFGQVGIDMIAGPSEVMIIADETARPDWIAADFLSQAEHDQKAACILAITSASLADAVFSEIERQTNLLEKKEIVQQSLKHYGAIILIETLQQGAELANRIAPEHLELMVEKPEELLPLVRHAGSIFLGAYSPEPLGDYFAGANHVLPTNGTARFSSPLSVDDFVKKSSVLEYSCQAFQEAYQDVARFARAEGLTAHARSAEIRFESREDLK